MKVNPNLKSQQERNLPLIIIHTKEDLAQFFPGVCHEARRKARNEWAMPCPRCGGRDRFIVSNGKYWCRQCGYAGLLARLGNFQPLTPEEAAQARAGVEAKRIEEERERNSHIMAITRSRIWLRYHQQLLARPDRLAELERQGIDRRVVDHFYLGLDLETRYFDQNLGESGEFATCESFTFPHFRHFPIGNVTGTWCTNIRHRLLAEGLEGDKYRPHRAGLGLDFFPALFSGCKWGVVVEGEKKAMVLWDHGVPAIGIWGVHALYDEWAQDIQALWPEGIFVLFDHESDPAKRKKIWEQSQQIAKRLGGVAFQLPRPGKPDDLLVSGQLRLVELVNLLVVPDIAGGVEIL